MIEPNLTTIWIARNQWAGGEGNYVFFDFQPTLQETEGGHKEWSPWQDYLFYVAPSVYEKFFHPATKIAPGECIAGDSNLCIW